MNERDLVDAGQKIESVSVSQRQAKVAETEENRADVKRVTIRLFVDIPGVAELADAADSKSADTLYRVGSTPSSGTILLLFPE